MVQRPLSPPSCPATLYTTRRFWRVSPLLFASTALTSPLFVTNASAQSLPTGGSVAAGSVVIGQPSGASLTVTQSSQSAVVNWQGFSVGQGNTVTFAQPNASSAILNRVTSDAPSTIAGQVNANGQVYLVNPNGIAITRSGTVNAGGGFVASTLGISDSDFMAGKRTFTGNGSSAGVSNAGTISVGRGGYAALIGGTVSNSGLIDVPLGKVGLGSGESATLDFSGDGFLQVAVPTHAGGKGALIKNSGTIRADGGSVVISAATAREAARNAINISGTVQARSIGGRSGSIVIGGGAGGRVRITGRLIAASRHASGGRIAVTGQSIKLKGATVDASGKTGGGNINIGGGRQGQGPLQRADTVSIDKATTIRADATQSGNGGNVVVWSDLLTTFAGTISARGGAISGNGGEAEVSGKAKLDYTGTTILTAANGSFGTLLLDPYNVVISNGTNNTGGSFTANTNDSIINATTLNNALNGANVTITTGAINSVGAQAGNITVAAPITWNTSSLLTLTAANAIAINANININGGGQLTLNTATASGQPLLSFGGGANVNFASNQSGQALTINGNNYVLVYTMAQLDAIDGANAANNNAAVTQYGAGLGGRYALAGNLNAAGTTYTWGIIAGTDPIITGQYLYFTGTLEGLGHTISNLTITASTRQNVGLIGTLAGTLRDIGVVGGIVSGNAYVGGLVGYSYGGTITQSYATGTVVGGTSQYSSGAGGLVGVNTGAIILSYATGAVSGFAEVGGLVGYNYGTIAQSYATGAVSAGSGSYDLGGLAGRNYGGSITQSYATGAVSGGSNASHVGGFVGENTYSTGTITQSYATGTVTAGSGSSSVGGFAGNNASGATISQSYWDTQTSGRSTSAGGAGVTGVTTAQLATTTLAALNGGGVVWGNAGNQTVPYLLNNVGPVILGSDPSATPTLFTPILTQANLEAINNNTSANYVLLNNLDLGGTTYTSAVIGSFSGTLNGLGYTISNLTISSGGNNVGLIGTLNSSGTVRDLSVAGGSISGGTNVGGLVGTNNGAVTQSSSTVAISGSANVGGLVGFNNLTISMSYATGAVSSPYSAGGNMGGLVGTNSGTVTQSYATGSVSGATNFGGLVGSNVNGTITQAYATGVVLGAGNTVGGLVGYNSNGTISQGYWDTQTSGQGSSAGGTGLTTAALQGALPSGFSSSAWGTGTGLYPYLTQFFPNGVQAVSGFAYKDAGTTALASGANGAVGVTVVGANATLGTASTGANGYYYVFGQPGTLPLNSSLIAYTTANSTTGATNAARIAVSNSLNGTGGQSGVDIWGPVTLLAATTSATTYSGVLLEGFAPGNLPTLPSGSAIPSFLTGAIPTLATNGTSFAIDAPLTVSNSFAIQTVATNAPLTVSQPITVSANTAFGLNAAGALTINSNMAVWGAGKVALAYDQNTNTAAPTDLSFGLTGAGFTGSLIYLDGTGAAIAQSAGGSLSINGTSYSLLYNFVDLAGASNGLSSAYALAGNLDGTNHTPFNRVVVNGLTKTLEGLGHTISNVTINATSSDAGLIGDLYSGGTVRDIGVVGGSVSGTSNVGGLVGYSRQGSTITQVFSAANVNGSGNNVGGLVGYNNGGSITQAYATGAVSGGGGSYVGGLVGANSGSITQAYATGAVSGGSLDVGGLVGDNSTGSITQAYATGAVNGGISVGGLVGYNGGGNITQVYATGAVSGGGNVGGLVGTNGGSITQSYWDTQTSGQPLAGVGAGDPTGTTGLTTAQLQFNSGSFMSQLGSAFGGGTGGLYPYLKTFFPNGVQAVTGAIYSDAGITARSGASVGIVAGGTSFATVSSGANGYYYAFASAGTAANGGNNLLAYSTSPNVATLASVAGTSVANAGSSTLQTGVNLYGNAVTVPTSAITLSTAPTLIQAQTLAGNAAGGITAATNAINGTAGQGFIATDLSGFTINQAVTTPNTFVVQTTASGAGITVSNPVTINSGGSLGLNAAGALAINSNITAQGAVGVALNAGFDITTVPGTSLLQLSFAQGASLTYTDASGNALTAAPTSNAGKLSINGNPYTLIYSMADLDGIDGSAAIATGAITNQIAAGGLSGRYALAGNLNAAGTTYTDAIVAGQNGNQTFSGTLEGLGHTVANLTINADNNNYVGLIGTLTGGTVRDLGVAGGSVSGASRVGGLVGYNASGSIVQAYATGAVSGSSGNAGGLVGYNNSGSITRAYAMGAVSGGGSNVGGLVGENSGTITQAYATGAVSGSGIYVGGLVGANYSTITQAYATGAVSGGSSYVGGLVGANYSTITQAYWDTQTSGQPVTGVGSGSSSGVTGLTTAQLQGTLALPNGVTFGLGSAFAGGAAGATANAPFAQGLYPYLASFAPYGMQAITGTAYSDAGATPLASNANGAVTIALNANGTRIGSATSGANGYYYIATPLVGLSTVTVTNGQNLLAFTASGAPAAATLTTASGGYRQTGVDLYGNALTVDTAATLFSQAPQNASQARTANASALATAAGSDATATAAITDAIGLGLHATDPTAGFTIDQTPTINGVLAVETCFCAPLTVSAPITLASGQSLGLLSGGALSINANITVNGAGSVALAYDASSPTNLSFGLTGSGFTGSLTYLDGIGQPLSASAGGALSINGNPYTLVYTMAQLDAIDGTEAVGNTSVTTYGAGLSGRYALAGNLNASGVTYGTSLVGTNNDGTITTRFSGTFSGLGHTIAALTINKVNGEYVGLFGYTDGATLRDISIDSVNVTGFRRIGGLVGRADNSTIAYVSVTGAATSIGFNGSGGSVGGLIGDMASTFVTGAHANVTVTGSVGAGGTNGAVGGLIGSAEQNSTVTQSYAQGNVTGSENVGGLIGATDAFVSDSYATGSVHGGNFYTGGLIGGNFAGGVILNTYSTGVVTGGSAVGGLVGQNTGGTVTSSYWNTDTSGISNGIGVGTLTGATNMTTAQLQGALPQGFGANVWGTGADLYPYLKTFFPNGVQAVSGFAYKDNGATLAASGANGAINVSVLGNGTAFGTASTGANGYYYVFGAAGSFASGAGMVAYTQANTVTGAQNGVTYSLASANLNTGGVNVYGGWHLDQPDGSVASLSALNAAFSAAAGSSPAASFTLANRDIRVASSSFTLDSAVNLTGTFALDSTGTVTQTSVGSIAANALLLTGTGGGFSLTQTGNAVGTIAANAGSVSFVDGTSLSTGSVTRTGNSAIVGVTTAGLVSMATTGDLTLAAGAAVSGASPVLSAGGAFINNAGATGVAAISGRWLVYSANPTGDTFGSLDSGNTAIWNAALATLAPGSVTPTGNRYLFANQPILTFTSTSLGKTYGQDITPSLAGAFTVSGYSPGVAGAFNADNAATTYTGAPVVTSAGAVAGAGVANSPYAVGIAQGSLAATSGYGFAFAGVGLLTVAPASVVVTALSGTSVYGSSPTNPGLSATGLQNGEGIGVLTGLSNSFGITSLSGVAGSPYTLTVAGLLTNPNYRVTSTVNGSWSVTPASVVVTALGGTSVYGSPPGNPGLSATGLQNGEGIGVLTGLSNSFGITSLSTVAGSPYTLTVAGLLTNPNYRVTSTVNGSWSVTPASVVVTALGGTSVYGSSPGNPGLSATGLQNGEGIGVLTGLSNSFGITSLSGVAGSPYTLTVAGLLTNPNYRVTATVNGTWSVTPASVVVTALSGTSVYGSSPANPGLSATGLQNGEGIGVLTGLSNSFGITSLSGVAGSPYTLTVAGLLTNPNYRVTATVNGAWSVTPASVVVTALGGTSVYGSSPGNPGLSATGLQNGEGIGVLTGLSNSFGITSLSGVAGSPYTLTVAGLLTNPNYRVTSTVNGSWSVTPASVVVTALSGTSVYGSSPANPGLSATGLQNGEGIGVLTGLSNSFGITSLSGVAGSPYTLTVAGLLTNPNYRVTATVNGAWSVTPASVVVTALGGTSVYGSSPGNPGLSATGLQNGEGIGVLTGLSNSFGITSLSGVAGSPYTLTVAGLLTNPNYHVTSTVNGLWSVTPASVVVTALGGTSVYGSSPGNPGLSATGLQNGEGIGVLTGLSNSFGITSLSTVAGSPYTLTVAGVLTNPNYVIAQRIAGFWSVTGAPPAGEWIASAIANDNFYPTLLPNDASPVFGAPLVLTSLGTGTLYADPRYDSVFVCFGGGSGRAQSCYAAGR